MSRPKTIERLNRQPQVIRAMKEVGKLQVSVGVHEDAGKYTGGDSPPRVAQVAFWQEFGTKSIPERPFLRGTFDREITPLTLLQNTLLNKMVAGEIRPKNVLDGIGFALQVAIQKRIQTSNKWAEPNAPSTANKKKKGGALRGATPLIDSGLMFRSITFKTGKRK